VLLVQVDVTGFEELEHNLNINSKEPVLRLGFFFQKLDVRINLAISSAVGSHP
jgi:hypothetical protein